MDRPRSPLTCTEARSRTPATAGRTSGSSRVTHGRTPTRTSSAAPRYYWYHDHAVGITRLNVYAGLAGFYLLRDREEAKLGLPEGPFEIPLAIQDRSFTADGQLYYPPTWQCHFFGDTALVNGKIWPYLNVEPRKYRFRILNGSTPASTA